jgi:hypothetical protein
MSIIFHLNIYNNTLEHNFIGTINLSGIHHILNEYNISKEECLQLDIFLHDKLNDSHFFEINAHDKMHLYIDSKEPLTTKLISIFDENKTKEIMTDEIINNMNKKSIELFNDKDFKSLVKIYYNKPDIFKSFFNYMSHGDIIQIKEKEKETTHASYLEEITILKSLGIIETDETIYNTLKHFDGHLNLTLRALLCKHACE